MTPALDPLPLPAPAGLLHAALLAAFLAHVVPMSVTLGGSFWALLAARRHRALAGAIAASLPAWTAFTVTTGVAALLFLQVLHGGTFFAASVTMAWTWLAVPALVLVGYGCSYWGARRAPQASAPVLVLTALLFTAVSLVQSTQMTFMLHPELHHALQTQDPRGLVLPLGLPALFPRWLHLLAGALGTSALWPMWLAAAAVRRGEPGARADLAFAAKGFSAATGAAVVLGLGFLGALPARALAAFRVGAFAPVALVASLALAVAAIVLARRVREAAPRRAIVPCAGAVLLLLALMAGMRDVVRQATLGPALDPAAAAAPQWGAMALFAATLAAGAWAIGWMVRAVTSSPPAPRRS